ncbi:MAG: fumarylacetoacetate hydrolase family protein, partial [Candidatus Binatia bacterium]
MKFASIKPDEIAVVKDDTLIAVGKTLARDGALPEHFSMLDLIEKYPSLSDALTKAIEKGNARPIDARVLKPPVERPSKIWAAAGNYKRGSQGLGDARGRGTAAKTSPEELLENIFLKPPSAITGPEDNILIPKNADSIFPELELCVVIGKKARHLSEAEAFDAIFGYTIMLDVTARGYG